MTKPSQIKNRGYWKVNGVEYSNKVQAILSAQEQHLGLRDITYHYNDTWWDAVDWSIEPSKSLDEIYVQRAKQLREKYKTLILRFSGGSDSVNILRTFVDNNIKIDIVSINLWKEGDPDNTVVPNNIEKELLAFPLLKQLQEQGADFKIIVSDQSELFSILDHNPKWFLDIDAPRFSVIDIVAYRSCTGAEYLEYNNPETCIIVGSDKPQVWCKNEKIWHYKIYDCLHSMFNPANKMIPEPFYWSADMPEIPIKQSHEIKNFYRNKLDLMSGNDDKQLITKKSRLIPIIYPKYFGHVDPHRDDLPYYDMTEDALKFKKDNGLGTWAPRGMGTDFTVHLSPYYAFWKGGIDLADTMIHRQYKNMDTIWQGGLQLIYTKSRWLGK